MTDELLTEEQEAERARTWLRENGIFIAAGVLFGLSGLFGWQGWQDYQQERAGEASAVWQQMNDAIAGERFNEVSETLALLESDYANTAYLDQARLALARMHMERSDAEAAKQQLQLLEEEGRDPQLRNVAALRRAQILIAEGSHDAALQLLGGIDAAGMTSLREELRGDALVAKGDLAAARDAYETALNADTGGAIDRNFVQMKLDDAAASLTSVAANMQMPDAELPALEDAAE